MTFEWYHSLIIATALVVLILAIVWYLRKPLPKIPESPAMPLPLEPIHLKFDLSQGFGHHRRLYNDQSDEWKSSLRHSGGILRAAAVKEIYLLHGTFVGSDPASVISSLRGSFPRLSQRLEKLLSRKTRALIDYVVQDNGNFVPAYAELLEQALDAKIKVKLHYWPSTNHHLGRLEGAVALLDRVSRAHAAGVERRSKKADRILLIGHSHSRQVFALFTQLLQSSSSPTSLGGPLWDFIARHSLAPSDLRERVKLLFDRKQRFDFVTLGGPVRYAWCFIPDMRVLHIVNHRGESSSVANLWAFWNTSSGDFVQQWGMVGSDNLAVTARERNLNRELDLILGKGWHTRLWLKSIVRRERLGDFGRTILMDYHHSEKPNSRLNFIQTGFGHGVYTRFDVMQFQIEVICKYMYEPLERS